MDIHANVTEINLIVKLIVSQKLEGTRLIHS